MPRGIARKFQISPTLDDLTVTANIEIAIIAATKHRAHFGLLFGIGAYVMALTTKGMIPGVPAMTLAGLLLAMILTALSAWLLDLALFKARFRVRADFSFCTCFPTTQVFLMHGWQWVGYDPVTWIFRQVAPLTGCRAMPGNLVQHATGNAQGASKNEVKNRLTTNDFLGLHS
jgi:hypothetical protein